MKPCTGFTPPGAGARAIEALAPDAVADGAVDRRALRDAVLANPLLLKRIEAAIHPLVATDRMAALQKAEETGAAVAVCDIPLLYETGGDAAFDHVAVVSAPQEVQRARVLARPGMTEAAFAAIRDKQMDDAEKRRRADFVIDTGQGFDATRAEIKRIMRKLTGEDANA